MEGTKICHGKPRNVKKAPANRARHFPSSACTIARSSYAGSTQKIGPWAAASVPLAVGALQEAMGKVKTAEAALRRLLVQPPGQAGPHWPRRGGRASVPLVTET